MTHFLDKANLLLDMVDSILGFQVVEAPARRSVRLYLLVVNVRKT
jgi:hypothetical protein